MLSGATPFYWILHLQYNNVTRSWHYLPVLHNYTFQQINLPVCLCCTRNLRILHWQTDQLYQGCFAATSIGWICELQKRPIVQGVAFAAPTIYGYCIANKSILPGVSLLPHHGTGYCAATDQFTSVGLAAPPFTGYCTCNKSIDQCCLGLPQPFRDNALATDQFYQGLHCCTPSYCDTALATDQFTGVAFSCTSIYWNCACQQTNFTRCCLCCTSILLDIALATDQFYQGLPCCPHHFTGYCTWQKIQFYQVLPFAPPFYGNIALEQLHFYKVCLDTTIYWILHWTDQLTSVAFAAPPFYWILRLQQINLTDVTLLPHHFTGYALATDQFYQVLPCWHQHFTG